MFKEKLLNNKRIYCSDILSVEHFFTSRDFLMEENKEEITEYLNIKKENLINPRQTHNTSIEIVREDKFDYPDCDGLILDKKGFAVYLNFADCVPIILYDNKNKIGAVIHGGWRGTAQKITAKAVEKMINLYSSNPKDITAVIGPAIGFEEFETSKEIMEKLSSTLKNKDGLFDEHHADLKNINQRQLKECGVEKIDVCPYCTVKNNDKFFSYRKENKTRNRHCAVLKL